MESYLCWGYNAFGVAVDSQDNVIVTGYDGNNDYRTVKYLVGTNPKRCGILDYNRTCKAIYTINATGTTGGKFFVDIYSNSSQALVAFKNSTDRRVCIGSCSGSTNVTLIQPDNGVLVNRTTVFVCNATGNQIKNVSMWINQSGTWKLNSTVSYGSGTMAATPSFVLNLGFGSFKWNCRAADAMSGYVWAKSNRTLRNVNGSLNISFFWPVNNTVVPRYRTFFINSTIKCLGAAGAQCGMVYPGARYGTGIANTFIAVDKWATPLLVKNFSGLLDEPIYFWNRTYAAGFMAYGVAVGSRDSVVITGYDGNSDYRTVKYNSSGALLWNRTYAAGYKAYGVAVDSQDNVVVAGTDSAKFLTVKYNSSGGWLWNRTYAAGSYAYGIAVDSQDNIIVTGNDASTDYRTVKYNSSGGWLWNRTYAPGYIAYGVAVDSQNNIIIAGRDGNSDYRTVKYNSSGALLWNRTYAAGYVAYGVAVDSQDNIIITGYDDNNNYRTVKYNKTGSLLWNHTYAPGYYAQGVAVDSRDNIIVTGYDDNNDYRTVKYNRTGSLLWNRTYAAGSVAYGVAVDSQDNVIVTGYDGSNDYRTVKYLVGSNPKACAQLYSGGSCNLLWLVNMTGSPATKVFVDVFANSSYTRIGGPATKHSWDRRVCIDTCANPPSVSLTSPADKSTQNQNVTIKCNATSGVYLKNLTLYSNFSGTWKLNSSKNLAANKTTVYEANWSFALTLGSYKWNCRAYDNVSQGAWATSNWTFVELSRPVIRFVNISPSVAYTNDSLRCRFNVTHTGGTDSLVNVTWYKWNGTTMTQFVKYSRINITNGVINYSTLRWNNTHHDERWGCYVLAYDVANGSAGMWSQNNVTIRNYSTVLKLENGTLRPLMNQKIIFYANYSKNGGAGISGVGLKSFDIGNVIWNTTDLDTGSGYLSGTAFFDYEGDGNRNDILVSTRYMKLRAFFPNGTEIKAKGWPAYAGSQSVTVKVFDANNDGKDEVAVYGSDSPRFFTVLFRNGTRIWNSTGDLGFGEDIIIGDFDGQGLKNDLAVVTYNKTVYVFNTTNGKGWGQLWVKSVTGYPEEIHAGNINGDGYDDVMVNTYNGGIFVFNGRNGSRLWNYSDGANYYGAALVDLDHDSRMEVVAGPSGYVKVFNETGSLLKTLPDPYWGINEIVPADLDGNGYKDDYIVGDVNTTGSWNFLVWGFNNNSNLLWHYGGLKDFGYTYSITTGDVDDDGVEEIIASVTGPNATMVFNRTGGLKWKYSLKRQDIGLHMSNGVSTSTGLAVGDVNRDGINDVITLTMQGYLYLLQSVSCVAGFNDSTYYVMNWNKTISKWQLNRTFVKEGTYKYNITCFKNGYQTQVATAYVGISDDPVVTLKNPANRSQTGRSVVFRSHVSATAGTLKNVSLYGNFSGTWKENYSINLAVIKPFAYDANISLNLSSGSYKWNYLAFNNNSQYGWAYYNWSIKANNSLPNVTSGPMISPSNPREDKDLLCNFTVSDVDLMDTLYANYSWYNNNILKFKARLTVLNGVSTGVKLGAGNTSILDVWNCSITPYDGNQYGSIKSVTIRINGGDPVINFVNISSYALLKNDSLRCRFNVTHPLNFDTLVNVTWYKWNGTVMKKFVTYTNINITNGVINYSVLRWNNTHHNDKWGCKVRAFDITTGNATKFTENNVTVSSYATSLRIYNGTNASGIYQKVMFYANYSKTGGQGITGRGLKNHEIGQLIWNSSGIGSPSYPSYSTRFFDYDKDGDRDEVLLGVNYNKLHAFYSNGTEITAGAWPANTANGLLDIEVFRPRNDGEDYIATFESYSYIRVFFRNGSQVWQSTKLPDYGDYIRSGDLDGDGITDDLAVGTSGNFVAAYNTSDGRIWKQMWNRSAGGQGIEEIHVGKVNDDKFGDVMVNTYQGGVFLYSGNNGSRLWNFSNGDNIYGAAFVDLDHDGRNEIVARGAGPTYIINETGSVISTMYYTQTGSAEVFPTDLDASNYRDNFVTSDKNYSLRPYRSMLWGFKNGTKVLWHYTIQSNDTSSNDGIKSINGGDINDEGKESVLASDSNYQGILAVNGSGALEWQYKISRGDIGLWDGKSTALAIGDINHDGVMDVAIASKNGYLHLLQSVTCVAQFNDSKTYSMVWNDSLRKWQVNRSFSYLGKYKYNITCIKGGYLTQTVSSYYIAGYYPVIRFVNITPNLAHTNDSLKCSFNVTHADGTDTLVNVTWYKWNGSLMKQYTKYSRINITNGVINYSTLRWNNTHHNERWGCEVEAYDVGGRNSIKWTQNNVTIKNYTTTLKIYNWTSSPQLNTKVKFYANYSKTGGKGVTGIGLKNHEIGRVIWSIKKGDKALECGQLGLFRFLDINNDGNKDDYFVAGCYALPTEAFGYFANHTQKWNLTDVVQIPSDGVVADFDNDSYANDILVGDILFGGDLLNESGNSVWTNSVAGASVAAAYLDKNHGLDMVVSNGFDEVTYAHSYNGTLIWKYNMSGSSNRFPHETKVADLNRDGVLDDMVVQYGSYFFSPPGIIVINKSGQNKWNSSSFGSFGYAFAVGDVNGNGYSDDIVFGYSGSLAYMNATGKNLWNYTGFYAEGEDYGPIFEVAFFDRKADGTRNEIVACRIDGTCFAVNASGRHLWNRTLPRKEAVVMAADLNDDGADELPVLANDTLFLLTRAGQLLWNTYVSSYWYNDHSLYGSMPFMDSSDNNGDGVADLGLVTEEYAYIIQDVVCTARFDDSKSYNMTWNDSIRMWQLDRTFTSDGTYRYNITCSKGGYTTQVASSYVSTGASTPKIAFVSPTPSSGNSMTGNSVYINTTVSDVVNTSAFFDWNRSLVGYWSMDFYNSSGVFDNSSYGNFGTFNGNLSTDNITTGKYGKGLVFDRVSDYVDAGTAASLDNIETQGGGGMTISAWIYPKSYGGNAIGTIINKYTGGSGFWFLRVDGNNNVFEFGKDYQTTDLDVRTDAAPLFNTWQHILLTWDGSVSSANVHIYRNGAELSSSGTNGQGAKLSDEALALYIGSDTDGAYFDGLIDEVRIWNRVLSPEEINASYNSGKYRLYHNFTGLSNGLYTYNAWAINTYGNMNKTATRNITTGVESTPIISFVPPTPSSGNTTTESHVYLNTTVSDSVNTSAFFDWNRSLVGYWSFEYYNASGVFDNSSYKNFGAFSGGLSTSNITTGKYGKGLTFDGVDDYVDVADSPSLNLTGNAITISAWVKYLATPSSYYGIAVKEGYEAGYGLLMASWDNKVNFELSGDTYSLYSDGGAIPNQWNYLAATYNGSVMKIYINGMQDTATLTRTGDIEPSAWSLRIGSSEEYNGYYFNGTIDEVSIFNRALSPEEINASYNSGKYRLYHNFTGLGSGLYTYNAWAINTYGNIDKTSTRNITVSIATYPRITFVPPTPSSGNSMTGNSVYINTTVSDVVNTSAFFDWNRSMVGYWSFEYYNSSGIFDNSTHKNFGRFNGGLSISNITTGKYGKGLKFDGVNDYVLVNDSPLFNFGKGDYTVSFWMKAASLTGTQQIIGKGDYTNSLFNGWILRTGHGCAPASDALEWLPYHDSSSVCVATGSILNTGMWYHVILLMSNGYGSIYVNNALQGGPTLVNLSINSPHILGIGFMDILWDGTYFKGTIDEVRIFNRALSPAEINASYNSGKYRLYHNFTGLSNGFYTYNAWAINTYGNMNKTATRNITVAEKPVVQLISPSSGSAVGSSVVLRCNASGTSNYLKNISLYTNFSGTWKLNSSKNLAANKTTVYDANWSFALTLGSYKWNCRAYDNVSQGAWATSNWTFDANPFGTLNVSIIAPANNTGVPQNGLFLINATVKCFGAIGATCGNATVVARYNLSSGESNAKILSLVSARPVRYREQPFVLWNSSDSSGNYSYAVAVDSQDNIIVSGYDSNLDYRTIKYNSSGSVLWNRTDTKGNYARGVAVDSHDNIIVAGYDSNLDYRTIKYNSSGSVLWNRTDTKGDHAYAVAVDSHDNIIVTGGDSALRYRTVKYNSSGSVLWNRTDTKGSEGIGVAVDSQDNIVVTGYDSDYHYRTVKYNSSGSVLWNRTDANGLYALAVAADSQNNIVVTGADYILNYRTIKYNSTGAVLWIRSDSKGDVAQGVAVDSQDNVIVTGRDSSANWRTLKYNSSGTVLWNRSDSQGEYAYAVAVDSMDNIIVTGYDSSKNYRTIKYYVGTNPKRYRSLGSGVFLLQVNASGGAGEKFFVDVFANSSLGKVLVASKNTTDRRVCIGNCFGLANVTLVSPVNNTVANKSVRFLCNITGNDIKNVSIYTNQTGVWKVNTSITSSGSQVLGNFVINLPFGTTKWNCRAYDSIYGFVWARSNYTLRVLNGSINITYRGPYNNTAVSGIFNLNTTIKCLGPDKALCGQILVFARYNLSSTTANTDISNWRGSIPFYIKKGIEPKPYHQIAWNRTDTKGTAASGVAVDSHDDIVVTGYDSNADYRTVKYNGSGFVLWNRTDTKGYVAYGVAVDSQDNIIITGVDDNADYRTVKYNGSGFVLWNRTDTKGYFAYGVAVDSYDNIIVTGYDSDDRYRTVKYNGSGFVLWNRTDANGLYALAVAVDSHDNIVVTGYDPDYRYRTVKYNSTGYVLWNRTDTKGEVAHGVAVDSHDNIMVAGYDSSYHYRTIKYNSSGSVLWNRTDTKGGEARGVTVDSQDNIVVTGSDSNSDYRTVKYNSTGYVLWNRTDTKGATASGVAVDSQDNIVVTGYDSNSDYRTIKYNTLLNPMDCGYMRSGQACETGWLINATGANGRAFWIDIYAVSNYSDLYGRTKDTWDRKICIGNCIPPTVQLLSPASGSLVGSGVVLRCNASGTSNYLKNISLYTNKTGSWQINQTVSFGASKPASYQANFSLNVTLGSFKWSCLAYDNASLSDWADSNWTFVRMNRLPNVTLIWPNDGNATTDYNRTPKLRWYGYDADGDKLNYTVLIQCMAADCGGYLERKEINLTYENWTVSEELEVDVPYNWTVRAFDGTNYSAWSTVWNFTVASHLVITLTNAKTNFGTLLRLQQANTTKSGDSIEPLVVRNDGNVYFDAFAKANGSLWKTMPLNRSYYQFMAGNATNIRTFNWSGSQTVWRNVSSENLKVIDTLNYSSHKSNATIELKVIVPYDEPPGARSSAMIVSGEVK